jgi:hypothetical protein
LPPLPMCPFFRFRRCLYFLLLLDDHKLLPFLSKLLSNDLLNFKSKFFLPNPVADPDIFNLRLNFFRDCTRVERESGLGSLI